MLFNSLHFFVFFPIVVLVYFSIAHRYRWMFLLGASYYFYMSWKPAYVLVLLFSTTTNFLLGTKIGKTEDVVKRKFYLIIAVVVNIGLLFAFKYFNFFNELIVTALGNLGIMYSAPRLEWLLPIGISFYTFQALSYVVDVYQKTRNPEKNFGIFALFVSFFPQLVAGPIERSTHLIPQFYKEVAFKYARTIDGLRLMLWGFFKKIVVADSIAIPVALVYSNPENFTGLALSFATILFAIQIYADFSGYTDIARGGAKILGFNLVINFDRPYASQSISEFWRRWHISLTSWFQDYVFTPLYIKLSKLRRLKDLTISRRHFVAFSLATVSGLTLLGLWHGAGLNFIVFGFSQALFIIGYHLVKKVWGKLPYVVANVLTLIQILVGFVFFRAASLPDAFYIFSHMFNDVIHLIIPSQSVAVLREALISMGFSKASLISLLCAIVVMEVLEFLCTKEKYITWWNTLPAYIRWSAYYALITFIILYGSFDKQPFIYFQF